MQGTAAVLSNVGPTGNKSQVAVSEDMIPLLCNFISRYLRQLLLLLLPETTVTTDEDEKLYVKKQLEQFFRRLWSADILDGVHHKITVSIFETIQTTLQQCNSTATTHGIIPMNDDMLRLVAESFQLAFSDGSMVSAYQDSLLTSLAIMLQFSKSCMVGPHNPRAILNVLALYPVRLLDRSGGNLINDNKLSRGTLLESNFTPSAVDGNLIWTSLRMWLMNQETTSGNVGNHVGAAVATAYVDGMLLSTSSEQTTSSWDPKAGCTNLERKLAKAIVLNCILTNDGGTHATAGEILWPAIHKGLSNAAAVIMVKNWSKADQVSRALLLLEYGVRFQALSGLGNGDLVIDKKTQKMLPPPQNIDTLLGSGVNFILYHVQSLVATRSDMSSNASRSSDARVVSTTFARLVSQLQSLAKGFPSSTTIVATIDGVLQDSVASLCSDGNSNGCETSVLHVALVFLTLTSGGEIHQDNALTAATTILRSQFDEGYKVGGSIQALRSIFQFAKWGALSSILPKVLETLPDKECSNDVKLFMDELFDTAAEAVETTPSTALVPLFESVVAAANARFVGAVVENTHQFAKVVQALFGLINGCDSNIDSVYMIDQICALLFQPSILQDEYIRLQEYPNYESPIRDAFRRLVKVSGTDRPHISRIVLSKVCAGWLKCSEIGLSAIPYRDDIVQLLVHKEDVVPVTSSFTSDAKSLNADGIELVANTDETSVSRGFLLVFLSKLPDIPNLSPPMLTELLHYIIEKLVDLVILPSTSSSGLIMYGVRSHRNLLRHVSAGFIVLTPCLPFCILDQTPEYCVKIRALQSLCVLSRFVTVDNASTVSAGLFEAMGKQTSHNQIRYFLEIFTLQFARMHAAFFAEALVQQIRRTDLSLQMIASLMIGE
jgi:hypothetical protein